MASDLLIPRHVTNWIEWAMTRAGKWIAEAETQGISLRLYDDLAEVKLIWQEFEKHAALTPFQTASWAYSWMAHIGRVEKVKPIVVLASDEKGLLFLLALQIEQGVLRKLSWLCSDLNDYNGPIIAADYTARTAGFSMPDAWRSILSVINAQPSLKYDFVRLEKMPELICGQANPMLSLHTNLNASHAYRTLMLGGWEAFYNSKRSNSSKSKDRYNRKKLNAIGETVLVCPEDAAGICASVDLLMEQKGQRFAQMGVSNLFEKPGHAAFYRAIAQDERELVHVSKLQVGDKIAATNLGLTFRGAYYYILTSYGQGETMRFSPGTLHMQDIMKMFCENGFEAFDFTIGDEPYKLEYCEDKNSLYDHMDASTMQGRAALAYWSAFQSTKRYIKQTPALWNAYAKLRGVFAARKAS